MKKIFITVLAFIVLVMGVFLVACDEETPDDDDNKEQDEGNGNGNGSTNQNQGSNGGESTTPDAVVLFGSELGENTPYKLEFTSNGDQTCYVSKITVNTAYTKEFELTIPTSSPDGDTVTAVNWGKTFVNPNLPHYITPGTFDNILDWFEANGYEPENPTLLKFTAYYDLYRINEDMNSTYKDHLLEAYPILEHINEIYIFTGEYEDAHVYAVIKGIIDQYSTSVALDEYNKIINILSEKTNNNTELIKKCYPDEYAPSNTNQATYVSSINLPKTLTSIGDYSFKRFGRIKNVTIPSNVTAIGKEAFAKCGSLEEIYFNATNCADFSSDSDVFAYATKYDGLNVVFGDNVTRIPANLFNYINVNCVVIPTSVTSIGDCAFYNCRDLLYINYKGSETQWEAITKGTDWNYNTYNCWITYNYTGE